MKQARSLGLVLLIGLLGSTVEITLAQERSRADSSVDYPEGCKVPVVILGEVASPSRFELRRRMRLAEVIALAGGLTNRSNGTIDLLHTEPPSKCGRSLVGAADEPVGTKGTYKLVDVLRGDGTANPYLRPGDVVTIYEIEPVYVVGRVAHPQRLDFRENLTVSQAIAMVGGLLADAVADEVNIYRRSSPDGESIRIRVSLTAIRKRRAEDVTLKKYDIVAVASRNKMPGSYTQPKGIPLRIIY